jgi:hypothetical protein
MRIYVKKIICLVTLLSFLFYSCGGTYRKSDSFNYQKMYDDINSQAEGKTVQVLMIDKNIYSGHNFYLEKNSTSLFDIQQQQIININTSEIHQIIIKSKISTTLVGILTGASIFAFLSYLSGLPPISKGLGKLVYITAILGSAAIGGFIGSFQNNDKIFIINE